VETEAVRGLEPGDWLMPGKIVFLLEEPSMKAFLDGLLPRLFPGWVEGRDFHCIPHEGKSDLDMSIPRKLSAWREPGVCFVIVRDNDNADCIEVKLRLREKCTRSGRGETLIRLVCQELESWYLGDLEAMDRAFASRLDTQRYKKRFTNPDALKKPSAEIERLIPTFQKRSGARRMGQCLNLQLHKNRSRSFRVFVSGVQKLADDMQIGRFVL
jgi:hypothetical protein